MGNYMWEVYSFVAIVQPLKYVFSYSNVVCQYQWLGKFGQPCELLCRCV